MTQDTFRKRSQAIAKSVSKWRGEEKGRFLESFSQEKWAALKMDIKMAHSLQDCKTCHQIPANTSFPISGKASNLIRKIPFHPSNIDNLMQHASQNISPSVDNNHENYIQLPHPKVTDTKLAAKQIYEAVNQKFLKLYGVSFASMLIKIKELGLTKKKTKKELNVYVT